MNIQNGLSGVLLRVEHVPQRFVCWKLGPSVRLLRDGGTFKREVGSRRR